MEDSNHCRQKSITEMLCDNVDSVVTVYTEACCFTGLLCAVTCNTVKMVTKNNHGCPGYNCYGKLTVIPICEIVAVTFCNSGA